MKFINRHKELKLLSNASRQKEASFIVLYGRRRIGKTRLLLEWVKQYQGIYWVADESSASIQRSYFAQAVAACFPGFDAVEYPSWNSILQRIYQEAKFRQWRGPLVIDEFPYLVKNAPELPSLLQRWIDHEAKELNLVLAIAGSSQSMMQGLVLDESAPLFGRASLIINLKPIAVPYFKEAFEVKQPRSIITAYTLLGGVPRYWELAKPHKGHWNKALDELILDPMGVLHQEPSRLLLEEQPSAISLRPLLDAIGLGAHRLSEIAGRLEVKSTSLSKPLSRLQELGLIQKEFCFGENEKNSKRTLYKISDPFFRLWFKIVGPNRSLLAHVNAEQRVKIAQNFLPHLEAYAWEELCRQAIPLLDLQWASVQRYWNKSEPEWDIAAFSQGDSNKVLLGECKWPQSPLSSKELEIFIQQLMAKNIPAFLKKPSVDVTYVFCVPDKPPRLQPIKNVWIVDASSIIDAFLAMDA